MSAGSVQGKKQKHGEGFLSALLARQRERELPLLLKVQSYRNRFFDSYFFIASVLGEEVFFITFIPFCCWNVSRQVALHLTFLLALAVGGGNMLKNYIQSPRPPPKIIWVNKTNPETDPGFPSTHTMTAFTIPWYLLIFYWETTTSRHVIAALALLLWWSISIAASRLYNGHHFFVDVVGGLCLAAGIMFVWSQYLRYIIDPIVSDPSITFPVVLVGVAAGLLYMHPLVAGGVGANPAAAETALVFGTCAGTALALWLHHYGKMTTGLGYRSSVDMFADALALLAARFVVGAIVVGAVRELSKKVYLPSVLYFHTLYHAYTTTTAQGTTHTHTPTGGGGGGVSKAQRMGYTKTNYKHSEVDVVFKFLMYTSVSFTVVGVVPHLCAMLGLFHQSDIVVFV